MIAVQGLNRTSDDACTDRQLSEKLAALEAATAVELRIYWKDVLGSDAPAGIREGLMRSAIAYRIQAQALGDVRLGQALVRAETGDVSADVGGTLSGVKLIRSWRGELHEVQGSGDGFVYRGESYRSLSAIARRITGTRWNGLTFFGVRNRNDLSRAVRRA